MNIIDWRDHSLKGQNIFIAPKNDLTIELAQELKQQGITCDYFVDSYKDDIDCIKPSSLGDGKIVLIYSPNYWKEISQALTSQRLFFFHVTRDGETISEEKQFAGYNCDHQFNALITQRAFWKSHLDKHLKDELPLLEYGFAWGDPNNENDPLGNYKKIKEQVQNYSKNSSHSLEIGTLGGKWTQYLLKSAKITCIDINSVMIDAIKKRYPESLKKIGFYISSGNELSGINSEDVDFIFCIDTLVRSSTKIIYNYIEEISRVLRNNGVALLHLPSNQIPGSEERGFTALDINQFRKIFSQKFSNISIDSDILVHGVLITLKK